MPKQAYSSSFALYAALLHSTSCFLPRTSQSFTALFALLAPSGVVLDCLFHLFLLDDGHRLLASAVRVALSLGNFISSRSDSLPYVKDSLILRFAGANGRIRRSSGGSRLGLGLVHLLEVEMACAGADAASRVLEEALRGVKVGIGHLVLVEEASVRIAILRVAVLRSLQASFRLRECSRMRRRSLRDACIELLYLRVRLEASSDMTSWRVPRLVINQILDVHIVASAFNFLGLALNLAHFVDLLLEGEALSQRLALELQLLCPHSHEGLLHEVRFGLWAC